MLSRLQLFSMQCHRKAWISQSFKLCFHHCLVPCTQRHLQILCLFEYCDIFSSFTLKNIIKILGCSPLNLYFWNLSLMQAISCNMFQLCSLLHFFAVLLAPNLNWNIFFKEKSLSTTYQMFKSMDADIKWHAIFEERTFQVLFCNNSLNQLTVCCFCLVCTARGKAVWGTSLMI